MALWRQKSWRSRKAWHCGGERARDQGGRGTVGRQSWGSRRAWHCRGDKVGDQGGRGTVEATSWGSRRVLHCGAWIDESMDCGGESEGVLPCNNSCTTSVLSCKMDTQMAIKLTFVREHHTTNCCLFGHFSLIISSQ